MSLFISFEGGEGSGKSTQAELLKARLEAAGHAVTAVHEPGSTLVGDRIRRLVKGVEVSPKTELLLFAAARAELVATVIKPSLAQGRVVIADRYADSTVAYQGYGRRLPLDLIAAVNAIATEGLQPAITFLLDVPVEEGLRRTGVTRASLFVEDAGEQRGEDETQSRFERETVAFHRRVRSGFLKLAGQEPSRVLVVDGGKPKGEIAEAVWQRVERLLVSKDQGARR